MDSINKPTAKNYYDELQNTFVEKAYRPAQKAADAYQFAPIEHTHSHDVWLRPRWCECKPYAGRCAGQDLGAELKHEIDYDERMPGYPTKSVDREVVRKDEVTRDRDQTLNELLEKVQL